VVLPEGTHRVVFDHHARGLQAGLALALLGAVGLLGALAREGFARRRRRGRAEV
jgi:hypothetical protein